MFKGFLSGVFWGCMVGGLVLAVLSLYAPLPIGVMQKEASIEAVEPVVEPKLEPVEAPADTKEEPAVEEEPDGSESGALEVPVEEPVKVAENTEAVVSVIDPVEVVAAAEGAQEVVLKAPSVDTEVAALVAPQLSDSVIRLPQIGSTRTKSPKLPNSVVVVDRSISDTPTVSPQNPVKEPPVIALNEAPEDLRVAALSQSGPSPRIIQVDDKVPSRLRPLLNAPEIGELTPSAVATPSIVRVSVVTTINKAVVLPQIDSINDQTVEDVSSDTPIGVPVEPILNPLEQSGIKVVTGRLPTITRNSTTLAEPASLPSEAVLTNNPLIDYASVFNTNAQSLFSIVIIDSGDAGVPREQLLKSSYPITVAIDPTAPNAAAIMQDYRDAGKEVVVLINDLPESAGPGDVAVAIEGYLNILDQAIAIMDPLDARLRENSNLLRPVLGTIENSGHGLVTYAKGLNTARQNARRVGVPSALVFRILDGEGERAPKIKRYLKRAAFNAGRDGSVVVVGHSYPETMTALLEWALEQNNSSLALAPLSAILKSDISQGS